MEFTSFGVLLYYLPVMLVGYYVLSSFKKARNLWLTLCGLGFYFLNGIECAVLLVTLAALNYTMGFAINRFATKAAEASRAHKNEDGGLTHERKAKKAARNVMFVSVIVNLAPLFAFVILPHLLGNFPQWFNIDLQYSPVVPFGMVFFALQGISYTADIFRGNAKWNASIVSTFVYFTFFPAVFAGPIIKYHEVANQIEEREITFDKSADGLGRLIVGLAKLCLIAEPLLAIGRMVMDRSNLSGLYTSAPVALMLVGLGCCTIGMYHFFSGFSDVAIGMGKMLGFNLPENFRHPHLATTVTAFWQRCYSSLTGWFEEYVYDSLSKKRSNNDKMVLHMLLMWLLIGLWTGPGLPHVIFGFWNFIFLLFEKVVEMEEKKKRTLFRHIYVIIVAIVSIIALNADTMYQFTLYISNLFGMKNYGFFSGFAMHLLTENWPVLVVGLICSFPFGTKLRQWADQKKGFFRVMSTLFYPIVMVVLAALIVLKLSGINYDPTQLFSLYLWS